MRNHQEFVESYVPILQDLIAKAIRQGADGADALIGQAVAFSHQQRMGQSEGVERSESEKLGLRVIMGKKQAIVSGNDFSQKGLEELKDRAIAMAQQVPEDAYCGLADKTQIIGEMLAADADFEDAHVPDDHDLIQRARAVEQAALAVKGITNSEGSSAQWSLSRVAMVASNGFMGARVSTNHSFFTHVIAGNGLEMEGDYDYASCVFAEDLPNPEQIGTSAGKRALQRLNPKKPPSGQVPIIFDKRVSASLLGNFAGVINGNAIAKKASFLTDCMGKQIFNHHITISDDPLRKRGLASAKFDGEGLPTTYRNFVEKGVLQDWVLDCATARQLGLTSTANAQRSISGLPSPGVGNFTLHAGEMDVESLYKDEPACFIVTHLMGMGVNGITGDYSQGAGGFWVEKGEIIHPVNEATIAGNLKAMFLNSMPANDLEFKQAKNAPSIRIDGMTVAS